MGKKDEYRFNLRFDEKKIWYWYTELNWSIRMRFFGYPLPSWSLTGKIVIRIISINHYIPLFEIGVCREQRRSWKFRPIQIVRFALYMFMMKHSHLQEWGIMTIMKRNMCRILLQIFSCSQIVDYIRTPAMWHAWAKKTVHCYMWWTAANFQRGFLILAKKQVSKKIMSKLHGDSTWEKNIW